MKAAIVLTSIHDCTELLNGYLANIAKYGREAVIAVIPDVKTPSFRIDHSAVHIADLDEQEFFLYKIGYPWEEIPRNSDNRRNIGYLMALINGADMIVSIDDDNYCVEDQDFIGEHEAALSNDHQMSVSVEGGWYNNCNLLRPSARGIYPRGLPYYARKEGLTYTSRQETSLVRINAGMWVGDPDLDAISWLTNPYHSRSALGSVALAEDTWCPINSQNTAVTRDMMAAYWFVRMDPPMDRFGDIFQGYFALKVAKHFGWTARFGTPFVRHIRNSHVYMKDIQKEIGPILLIEELLPKLMEYKLSGSTVVEAYLSLADFIDAQDTQVYRDMARRMKLWATTCQRIQNG